MVGDEIAKAQQEDDELKQLIELKTQGKVIPENSPLRKYAPVWPQLQIRDSRLVRAPPANTDAASQVQVVLPQALVPKVLAQLHDSPTGGHLGIQKLQGKVKDRFYWLGWFGDVKEWCRQCVDCASRKIQGRAPRAPLQISTVSRPYERVALDILGPLPETSCKNKYVLVVGDYFSKWTEAYPLPNQEAHTIAKVLVEEWVCRFGAPRSIHSDQGRSFESTLFRELCQLLNIHKTRTTPYHPQSDGLIERFNRTLLCMLSLFVEENQSNWDTLLPYVMMAYRSSVHASTGYTPYKVLFGREMVLPVDIMLDVGAGEAFSSVSAYVGHLVETLSTVVEAVRKHQAKASNQQKTNFDFRASLQFYSEGEFVWVLNKARRRGLCPKLQRRFKGPYKIRERVTEVLYRVALVGGGGESVVHFNRLKPYLSPCPGSPPAQDVRTVGPPGQSEGVPSPGRGHLTSRQGAGGPSQRLPFGETSEGGSPGERGEVQAPVHRSETMDTEVVLEQSCESSLLPVRGGSCQPDPAQGRRPVRERKAPAWSRDYDLSC